MQCNGKNIIELSKWNEINVIDGKRMKAAVRDQSGLEWTNDVDRKEWNKAKK